MILNLNKEVHNMQIWKSIFCETSSSKTVSIYNLSLPILWRFSYIQHHAVMILNLNWRNKTAEVHAEYANLKICILRNELVEDCDDT